MEVEGLESAVVRWTGDLLNGMAGESHYVECHPGFDGLVAIVKRRGARTWKSSARFTITWQEMLRAFAGTGDGLMHGWVNAVKERAV